MLQHFRKPKWRHAKASVRRQAVEQLAPRDSEADAILRALGSEDPDPGVRRAAVRKLSDLDFLRWRMGEDADAGVVEAAAVRYRQILAGGGEDADLDRRIAELDQCPDARVLAHVLRGGREEALRIAALERSKDESVIADAAVNDPVARVRQAAVERLEGEAGLRRVMERTRQGDRKVYRLAREKLHRLETAAAEREARARERQQVLTALEALAARDEGLSAAELARLENRWQAVAEDADSTASNRFGERLAASRQRLRELQEKPAPETQAPAPRDLAAEWHACVSAEEPDQLESMLEVLAAALEDPRSSVPDALAEEAALAQRFIRLRERLRQLGRRLETAGNEAAALAERDALLNELAWPEALPRPRTLSAVEAVPAASQDDEASDETVDHRTAYEALERCLAEVEDALQAGNLRAAQRALKAARQVVDALPRGGDARTERELKRYTARVAELRDWRRFATLPKQEQLCEEMEALIDADLPPPERAAAIKSLQEAWKATGGSDSAASRQLWERFQKASDQAFEPCRAYFDEQARQREANLAERRRILEQLESFLDRADVESLKTTKLIEIRAKAREEWNHFSPVERSAAKSLSRRFERRMDALTERIRAAQEAHRQQKAALLEQARALEEVTPLSARLEQAKALQAQWRDIGPAGPAQERKLFRAFKAACDAVFEARDESRRAERESQEQNKAAAERLCERLESLAESDVANESDGARALDEAQAAFQALGALPRGVREGVERRFEKAVRGVRNRIAAAAARQAEAAFERLRQRAALCAEMEAAAQAGGDAATIRERWDALADDPEALPGALAARWESALAAVDAGGFSDAALADAAAHARRLCVAMEILAGIESPAEDAELRMEVQVERLHRGLADGGAAADAADASAQDLELAWLANGPLPAGAQPALESRFRAAREAAWRAGSAA